MMFKNEQHWRHYETYDKVVKGMCIPINTSINSTFIRNSV